MRATGEGNFISIGPLTAVALSPAYLREIIGRTGMYSRHLISLMVVPSAV